MHKQLTLFRLSLLSPCRLSSQHDIAYLQELRDSNYPRDMSSCIDKISIFLIFYNL